MRRTQKKQGFSISQILATTASVGLVLYFGYHLMHGDRGYFALKGLEVKLVASQQKLEQKMAERVALENRVKRLRPDSLDLDMLDERTRIVLGYVKPNEKVLIGAN